jgi:hypothetical protein
VSPCPACIARGKTWEGDDPTCAFLTGTFDVANWNCATMNALRRAVETLGVAWRDDLAFGAFGAMPICDVDRGFVLVLGWYKNRGRTSLARAMGDDCDDALTLDQATLALEYAEREAARRGSSP